MIGAAELTDEIVCAAVAGDRAACAHVFDRIQARIRWMIAARLCPTREQLGALDEAAQEVMLALTTALPRLRCRTVAGLNAFVSSIVTNQVSQIIRSRGFAETVRRKVGSLDATIAAVSSAGPLGQFLSGGGTSPSSAVARREQVEQLMTALGQIKREHRDVITLVFFDELPVAEAAEQMGVSRPAVAMLLLRAIHSLRRQMTGSSTAGQVHEQH